VGRVNISIPDDLAPLVSKWRRKINLSEICTQALRHELEAAESHRSAVRLLTKIRRSRSKLEQDLVDRFGLVEVILANGDVRDERDLRESLGHKTADYLNQNLTTGAVLALAGGRQSWCVVENLDPRQLEITIVALGYRQNDPHVLHAHANTLATMLWLLFSPRAVARLVGADPEEMLNPSLPVEAYPKYFVVGSCSAFDASCPLARLLGDDISSALLSKGAATDFLYNFFDEDGRPVPVSIPGDQSIISADCLFSLSKRPDMRVLLVAGGREKLGAIRSSLEARLCNILVTDTVTAQALLGTRVRTVKSRSSAASRAARS
jgi:deoxyribonucleoside regulator